MTEDLEAQARERVAESMDDLSAAGFFARDGRWPRRWRWHVTAALGPPLDPDQGRPIVDYHGRAFTFHGARAALNDAVFAHVDPERAAQWDARLRGWRRVKWLSIAAMACAVGGLFTLVLDENAAWAWMLAAVSFLTASHLVKRWLPPAPEPPRQ